MQQGMGNGVATLAQHTIISIKIAIDGLVLKSNRWGGNYFKLVNWREFCLFILQNRLRLCAEREQRRGAMTTRNLLFTFVWS